MTGIDLLTLIGGLGVLLFALRFLTQGVRRSIGRWFRPVLLRYLATPGRAFLSGLVVTVVVQASSITITTTMGLLAASMISLEQALYVMLGATLGTAAEFWLIPGHLAVGRLLVGCASIALVVVRHPLGRELIELVMAVGFAFVGLEMMARGVNPLVTDPAFVAMIRGEDGASLLSQVRAIGIGFVLTALLQSSSALLPIALDLAAKGVLTVPAGVALILGANVGTTLTALIASAEVDWRGRRLAIAHGLVKLLGAGVALFVFPAFMGLVTWCAGLAGPGAQHQLVVAHIAFNAVNCVAWALGAGMFVRVLRAITPADPNVGVALPPVVRRMLASSPERALAEAERQLDRMRQLAKALVDECMALIAEPATVSMRASPIILGRQFDEVREALQELLIQLTRLPAGQHADQVPRMLEEGDACHALYEEALGLLGHLQRGLVMEGHFVPPPLAPKIEALARAFDGCWIRVVFPGSTPDAPPVSAAWATLDQAFFTTVREQKAPWLEGLTWLQETVARLGRIAERLQRLLDTGARSRGSRVPMDMR